MPDMKKLLEKAKSKFAGAKKGNKLESEFEKQRKAMDAVLDKLWPHGTWTLAGFDNKPRTENDVCKGMPTMDFVVHCFLIDQFWLESFVKAEELAGRKLNPGMFGERPETPPQDWKPSKRIIDHHATRAALDATAIKHITERLAALKKLGP
jgi:hypothetical protein